MRVVQRSSANARETIGVMKLSTENSLRQRISVKHSAFSWLVMHAADVITVCQIKSDGRTAYERIKGLLHTSLMLEFGMSTLYR